MAELIQRRLLITGSDGIQTDENVTVERVSLLLELINDEEHGAIILEDNEAWYLEFSSDYATFGNAENSYSIELENLDRNETLVVAAEFINGDFDVIRNRG